LSGVSKTWIYSTTLRTVSCFRFHENSSSGSQAVPYGQTWRSWLSLPQFGERAVKTALVNKYVFTFRPWNLIEMFWDPINSKLCSRC
jgi:hypothetical protein